MSYIEFLKALPCFASLTETEYEDLASLLYEIQLPPHETIVLEDEVVDSVFIITEGEAEVIHEDKKKKRKIPIAKLTAGETIGLDDTGFFSKVGTRTATVKASTFVTLLKLDLPELHDFLEQHPHIKNGMEEMAEDMLRMQVIKKSLPFTQLSPERLRWLAQHVTEKKVKANDIIFHQGEIGDECFLIRSGRVEIVADDNHQLAVLTAPMLFGEATLITHRPRNATARALEDCKLYVLAHEHLSELLETEKNVTNMFMTLMVDRSRPVQNPNVKAHEGTVNGDYHVVILKNPDNGSYFKLNPEGWFVWQMLDGAHTMQEITMGLADHFFIFAPDMVAALISKLAHEGFVTNVALSDDKKIMSNEPLWARWMWHIRSIMEARVAIGDADKWMTSLYEKVGFFFFSSFAKILMTVLAVTGIVAFGVETPQIPAVFQHVSHPWTLLVLIIPFMVLAVMLHELGHALATKAYGQEVHYMGVGWYWFGPVAFTDTSDMWLSTRWPRVCVNLAGVYVDVLIAGLCALLVFVFHHPYIQAFLWLFALYTYVCAFRMLSPLQDLDGYYVLMDVMDRSRLRHVAILWLLQDFPNALRQPRLFLQHKVEMSFWLICLLFLVLVSLLTWYAQAFVFAMMGWQAPNFLGSLILPILMVIFSSLSVLAEIRHSARLLR